MKTQHANNALAFAKASITELQQDELLQVKGGGPTDYIIKTMQQTLTDCTLSTQPPLEL